MSTRCSNANKAVQQRARGRAPATFTSLQLPLQPGGKVGRRRCSFCQAATWREQGAAVASPQRTRAWRLLAQLHQRSPRAGPGHSRLEVKHPGIVQPAVHGIGAAHLHGRGGWLAPQETRLQEAYRLSRSLIWASQQARRRQVGELEKQKSRRSHAGRIPSATSPAAACCRPLPPWRPGRGGRAAGHPGHRQTAATTPTCPACGQPGARGRAWQVCGFRAHWSPVVQGPQAGAGPGLPVCGPAPAAPCTVVYWILYCSAHGVQAPQVVELVDLHRGWLCKAGLPRRVMSDRGWAHCQHCCKFAGFCTAVACAPP